MEASSVLESSSVRFLGLRWASVPFQHRSAGWFVLVQVGHFGFFFLVPCPSLCFCSSFLYNFRQSSLTCQGWFAKIACNIWVNARRKEACSRSCRVVVGALDNVRTGMLSPPSSPLSSKSRSKWVTISSFVEFSSLDMVTDRFSFAGNLAYKSLSIIAWALPPERFFC